MILNCGRLQVKIFNCFYGEMLYKKLYYFGYITRKYKNTEVNLCLKKYQ